MLTTPRTARIDEYDANSGDTAKLGGYDGVDAARSDPGLSVLRRRLVSALVTADANHPTSPSRRLVLGTVLGVAAAVLTAAAFGVIGLLDPSGSAAWRQGGQVILEQESGARYILGQDNLLHPVLNYASARLLAGGNADTTVTVSASTLSSASRGAMLGIPGAPDSLPGGDRLAGPAFTTCSRTPPDLPAASAPVATVIVGPTAPVHPLAVDQALPVAPAAGTEFLITAGHRYRLPGQAEVVALGYEDVPALPVAASWLDTVPAGHDLGMVAVPDAGAPGPAIGGTATRVGQVLGDGAFYLVAPDGVAPIGGTAARLVLDDPANAAAYPDVVRLSPAVLDAAPRSPRGDASSYPADLPTVVAADRDTVLCATGDGTDDARISTSARLPLPQGGTATRVTARTDARVADEVYVPPGSGALVREQVGGTVGPGGACLVTDTGVKYPVPSQEAVAALGYGGVTARPVAGTLLALLPTGPRLDPVAARQVVAAGGGGR